MGAYMYPIQIKREPQVIHFTEIVNFDEDRLTLEMLAFVGKDNFSVYENSLQQYEITVFRSRLETPEEVKRRVEKEEKYMEEYTKRRLQERNRCLK